MTFTTKKIIQDQIGALEHNIAKLSNEINDKQKEIDSFEYEDGEMLSFNSQDDLYNFLNNQ